MGQTQTQLRVTSKSKGQGSQIYSKPDTAASRVDKPILVLDSMHREMNTTKDKM